MRGATEPVVHTVKNHEIRKKLSVLCSENKDPRIKNIGAQCSPKWTPFLENITY